jgi:threonine dehydratase
VVRLTTSLIEEAANFLQGRIRRTPIEHSRWLSERLGVPVWLKLESLQITGSFKIRGALFRMSQLTPEEQARGILTCSAGNHGKAVAYAAKQMGVTAVVCVPSSIDRVKFEGIQSLGADIRISGFAGYDDTEEWAKGIADREGLPFLSAFDDTAVMAGNGGTLALEVLEEAPDARAFILPVGGGGMMAGFGYLVKQIAGSLAIGCQHELSPALKLSLEKGEAVTKLPAIETAAGGVEGGLGPLCFDVLRNVVDRVALVTEEEIWHATRWMLAHHQYLIEPSAAVAVAACLTGKTGPLDRPAVVVLSGRNLSFETAQRILT